MPTRILALLLLLIALVAAGCGGDDEPSSGGGGTTTEEPSGEALSNEDYIDEINAAQNDFVAAAEGLNLSDPGSPGAFADSIDELVGSVDQLTSDLEAINPPEEVADLHQQLIDQMEEYGTSLDENVEDLRSEDAGKLQAAAQNIAEASNTFSQDFGGLVTQINEQLGAG